MKKKFIIGGLVTVVLILIITVLNMGKDKSDHKISTDGLRNSLKDPTLDFQRNSNFNMESSESWRVVLSHYRKWAVYPPNSRPLEAGDEYLLDYRRTALLPMGMHAVKNGKVVPTKASCLFQPERSHVTEGEKGLFTLKCTGTGKGNLPLEIIQASVSRVGSDGPVPARGRIVHGDDGRAPDAKAGDGQYTFTFTPDPRKDIGDMSMDIKFRILGMEPDGFVHEMKAGFYSSPVAPARFTGKVRERLERGSLVLSVELDVKKPGDYEITGNLETQDGTPVALARAHKKLTAGKNTMDLLFFGKIFHDKAAFGTFRLKGLRGKLENLPISRELTKHGSIEEIERRLKKFADTAAPGKEQIPYSTIAHETREYDAKDFSNREYDSEAKRDRIQLLTNFMKNPPE